jgi:hypothetical protein
MRQGHARDQSDRKVVLSPDMAFGMLQEWPMMGVLSCDSPIERLVAAKVPRADWTHSILSLVFAVALSGITALSHNGQRRFMEEKDGASVIREDARATMSSQPSIGKPRLSNDAAGCRASSFEEAESYTIGRSSEGLHINNTRARVVCMFLISMAAIGCGWKR